MWVDAQSSFPDGPSDINFDEVGNYRHRSNKHELHFFDAETFVPHNLEHVIENFVSCNNITTKSKEPECEAL